MRVTGNRQRLDCKTALKIISKAFGEILSKYKDYWVDDELFIDEFEEDYNFYWALRFKDTEQYKKVSIWNNFESAEIEYRKDGDCYASINDQLVNDPERIIKKIKGMYFTY